MKKVLLIVGVSAALIAGRASGTELAAPTGRTLPAVGFSWTGFYIGGHIAGAFQQGDWSNVDPPGLNTSDANFRHWGFAGGGQIGFNYQYKGFLLGIEAERSWSSLSETQNSCYATTFPALQPQTCTTQSQWFADVAVRLGVAWQRLLLYAKVGESWGHFNYDNACMPCFSRNYYATETRAGRITAGGIEYALLDNLTLKIEYDYLDFGKETLNFLGTSGDMFTQDIANRIHVLKLGVNYLFGWPR